MDFSTLVTAGLLLLQQSNPTLYAEASYVTVQPADPTSPYAGFLDLNHPEIVWINPNDIYNPPMMRGQLAHELTHHLDWRNGILTQATCGDDYIQAEYRAFKAQMDWQPWQDTVMLNYVRGNYSKPCPSGVEQTAHGAT